MKFEYVNVDNFVNKINRKARFKVNLFYAVFLLSLMGIIGVYCFEMFTRVARIGFCVGACLLTVDALVRAMAAIKTYVILSHITSKDIQTKWSGDVLVLEYRNFRFVVRPLVKDSAGNKCIVDMRIMRYRLEDVLC